MDGSLGITALTGASYVLYLWVNIMTYARSDILGSCIDKLGAGGILVIWHFSEIMLISHLFDGRTAVLWIPSAIGGQSDVFLGAVSGNR